MDDYEELRRWRKKIPDMHNESYRRKWDKAVSKQSMRAAVDSKCLDCTCWQKREIQLCPCITCPLWCYRPYQLSGDSARQDAIRGHVGKLTDSECGQAGVEPH